MAKRATKHEPEVRLDNLTLARKEGWQRFVNTAARVPPEPLTRRELETLGEEAFDDYNRQRRVGVSPLGWWGFGGGGPAELLSGVSLPVLGWAIA